MPLGTLFGAAWLQLMVYLFLAALSLGYQKGQDLLTTLEGGLHMDVLEIELFDTKFSSYVPRLDYGAYTRGKDSLALCLLHDGDLQKEVPWKC
ncbi:hypothetical protein [Pseudobacteriovorax antillogorgiicola]|uniref:Uncharacterized protein n=1 Tax=Pseudobacteriovorax antillogorgiicola TaxID=1513793 RepID=A0A1Y6BJH4_9BACT|nr:hypothetical protein [Pseudobacteriovorax antillogorgiicola]TCS55305.1 hypothetical protein EDD56_10526 [Pseudobacteriovorax antillogorgiicola]SMF14419.1 hypothetical protein SAMN06296036_105298 [Pseudobacteriovorax antillogorgiicola]